MDRKDFIKKGAIAATGLGLFAQGCKKATEDLGETSSDAFTKQYKWKMLTTWPPNFPVLGEGCTLMAEWVRKMSGGRLDITVYGGGKLVPALEAFDVVSLGTAEMAHGAAYYWAGKVPAAQFFATVPFGMNAQQMNAWLVSGGGQELWDEVYEAFQIKAYPAGNTGVQMGGWYNKEINSLEDLKGLKIRMPGIGGKVINKAGGTAVSVAGGEIYTNLERGVIDATEWIGPYHDYKMGFHKIAKYYYYPGWHEPGTTLEMIVNKEKLASLPEDLQAILETAIYRLNHWMICELEAQNNLYLEKLIQEEGIELRVFPDEVIDRLRELTEEVLKELSSSNPLAARIYQSYESFRENASSWAKISEKIFLNQLQK